MAINDTLKKTEKKKINGGSRKKGKLMSLCLKV